LCDEDWRSLLDRARDNDDDSDSDNESLDDDIKCPLCRAEVIAVWPLRPIWRDSLEPSPPPPPPPSEPDRKGHLDERTISSAIIPPRNGRSSSPLHRSEMHFLFPSSSSSSQRPSSYATQRRGPSDNGGSIFPSTRQRPAFNIPVSQSIVMNSRVIPFGDRLWPPAPDIDDDDSGSGGHRNGSGDGCGTGASDIGDHDSSRERPDGSLGLTTPPTERLDLSMAYVPL
jgi:hypothetical protein